MHAQNSMIDNQSDPQPNLIGYTLNKQHPKVRYTRDARPFPHATPLFQHIIRVKVMPFYAN